MIDIDDMLISEDIIRTHFHCHIQKCKGQCCVEGVCGAPLDNSEKQNIKDAFDTIKPDLSPAALRVIEEQGLYVYLDEHGLVTPTIGDGICVYGIQQADGTVLCAFEKAFYEGKITWQKPISCHLFPIRISTNSMGYTNVNYEAIDICSPACRFGQEAQMPLYVFLKDALIRRFGADFYAALCHIAQTYYGRA